MDNNSNPTVDQAKKIAALEKDIVESRRRQEALTQENQELKTANEYLRRQLEEAMGRGRGTLASGPDGRKTRRVMVAEGHAPTVPSGAARYHPHPLSPSIHSSAPSGDRKPRGARVRSAEAEAKGKAFLVAAEDGRLADVQELLCEGVPLSYTDDMRRTALHWAAEGGHSQVVAALISAGADVAAKDELGCTALHTAATEGHRDVVTLLIEARAPVDAKDNNNCTALHEAACYGRTECAELLLDAGANVNAVDVEGETALHHAAVNNTENCIRLLMLKGVDSSIKNKEGKTAKDLLSACARRGLIP